jgi:hypothetical protein
MENFIFLFILNPTKNGSLSFSFYPTAPLRAVKANHNERRGIRFGLLFRSDFPIFSRAKRAALGCLYAI